MHVCMYVCMYACMHVCIYVYNQQVAKSSVVLELEQVLHKFEDGKQKIERYLRAKVQAK